MTSDAKIGLLLGLVFIFIIAFVINGLPSLRPPISKVGATTKTPLTNEDFMGGVAGKTDGVTDWASFLDQQRTGSTTAPAVVAEPKPVVQELPQTPPAQVLPPSANQEGVRSSYSLEALLNHLTPTIQSDRVSTINLDTPKPAPESPAAGWREAVAPPLRSEPRPESRPGEAPARVEPREPARPATVANTLANIPGGKLYLVVEGDNLASIAKKVYGPEEGNRVVNIQRIFQANQVILKSPDSVIVGQKLIIPPLPKPTATAPSGPTRVPNPNRPADVLPKDLFEKPKPRSEPMTISEKVESLGRRAAATIPAPIPEGRWYTVQDGDNLWKIAASQLGAGSRWDEIHKLNADVLTSEDSLTLGMRLRLPPK